MNLSEVARHRSGRWTIACACWLLASACVDSLSCSNGTFRATLTDYAAAMREEAQAKRVELIDLNMRSLELYRMAGYEQVSKQYFMPGETTHFQKQGAVELARLVSEGLAATSGGLAAYVK